MDFTAIDFETANRRRDSACQLAAVVVRSGKIVDTAMWMIRPEPFYFSPSNIAIHGISPAKVRDEPTFAEHWPAIAKFLYRDDASTYDCIIAHNASFDIGVMLGSMESHSIDPPDLPYNCTRLIARQTWPGRPRYGLKPLAEWLGIHFRHHDALEDSVACAKILIAAGIHRGVSTLEELEATLKISRGTVGPSGSRSPTSSRKTRRKTTRSYTATARTDTNQVRESLANYDEPSPTTESLDIQRLMIRASFIRSLSGEHVAFTGVLRKISRPDAEGLAKCLGGNHQSTINRKTTVLVVGDPDERTIASGRTKSVKQEAAEQLRTEGQSIRIMSEDEFLSLVIYEAAN